MNLANGLNSVQVVNTGIETNFVHDDDSSLLSSSVEFPHSWGDVAGGDYVSFALDSGLDDLCVEDVGDQRDDKVMGSNSLL